MLGSLFLMPLLGAAAGAGIGALHGAMKGVGITKDQLETIRSQITEGTSALFLMTEEGNLDRLGERFHGMHSKLVATNLTEAERSLLLGDLRRRLVAVPPLVLTSRSKGSRDGAYAVSRSR